MIELTLEQRQAVAQQGETLPRALYPASGNWRSYRDGNRGYRGQCKTMRQASLIAFLGFVERSAQVQDGHQSLWKYNSLGLKHHFFSLLYPFTLRDGGLAVVVYDPQPSDSFKLVWRTESGAEAGTIDITFPDKVIKAEPEPALTPETTPVLMRTNFRALLEQGAREEVLQTFIEENPVLPHQFSPQELWFKAPVLTSFKTDFVILSHSAELLGASGLGVALPPWRSSLMAGASSQRARMRR